MDNNDLIRAAQQAQRDESDTVDHGSMTTHVTAWEELPWPYGEADKPSSYKEVERSEQAQRDESDTVDHGTYGEADKPSSYKEVERSEQSTQVKISFNENGSIIVDQQGERTCRQLISSGTVYLTREQAQEAHTYGWEIVRDTGIENLVVIERFVGDYAKHIYGAAVKPDLDFTIAKLECKTGDTLVLKVQGLNAAYATCSKSLELWKAYIERHCLEGVKVLIIDKEVDIAVIRVL